MTDNIDNVIQIDVLRLNRKVPKKCKCKQRQFTVDTENREITCGCGMVVDPFEAMLDVTMFFERINRQHTELYEQKEQWLKQKPHSIIFKNLEHHYRKGTMLPHCPKCGDMFDYKDITAHTNAQFYRKLEQKQNEKKP